MITSPEIFIGALLGLGVVLAAAAAITAPLAWILDELAIRKEKASGRHRNQD